MASGGKREGSGRKKGVPNKVNADIRAAARRHTAKALEIISKLMIEGESEQVRLAAAKEIMDRGHGKPMQSVEHSGEGGGPIKASVEVAFVSTKNES